MATAFFPNFDFLTGNPAAFRNLAKKIRLPATPPPTIISLGLYSLKYLFRCFAKKMARARFFFESRIFWYSFSQRSGYSNFLIFKILPPIPTARPIPVPKVKKNVISLFLYSARAKHLASWSTCTSVLLKKILKLKFRIYAKLVAETKTAPLILPGTAMPTVELLPTKFLKAFLKAIKFFGVFVSCALKTFFPSNKIALIFDPPISIPNTIFFFIAGGEGFEPSYQAPKACVLPLDDPPIKILLTISRHLNQRKLQRN